MVGATQPALASRQPMLNNLDIVLSFATVMLGVSMLVTVLTQTISALLTLRGAQLKAGLKVLFHEAGLDEKAKESLPKSVLKPPLLADGLLWTRLAPAIRKN